MMNSILTAFGFREEECKLLPFGNGLINHTWLLTHNKQEFILQRINERVFKNPAKIAENIAAIGNHLQQFNPAYFFVHPVKTIDGKSFYHNKEEGYFRLFAFIKDSHAIDIVTTPKEAFEAAKQFGKFTCALRSFDASTLHITLPDFHNLSLRYQQFTATFSSASTERLQKAQELISFLKTHYGIVEEYNKIKSGKAFKKRVTHHDTKISNVLFDKSDNGLCVIDLDTVMPGYFISDVGDMMRTYLSPVSEEEKDFSKIEIREDFFQAIAEGYLTEMHDELTADEKAHFVYAGKYMIYMQALRFLTDYLNDDVYYGQKYEEHNLVRAENQGALLQKLMEKESELLEMISKNAKKSLVV